MNPALDFLYDSIEIRLLGAAIFILLSYFAHTKMQKENQKLWKIAGILCLIFATILLLWILIPFVLVLASIYLAIGGKLGYTVRKLFNWVNQ